ncbi:sensor histidine kinase [Clostridium lundense]|uniref:sensor histidine kinase n=1 Tax=Clostridium lundense TaxID=319475 RepID=UPI000486D249|nr:PocR ligand-binding domain-containing protein [Clostridium lundense]
MNYTPNLQNIIEIEMFQKIQDDIANATGLSIITTDYKGKPVTSHSRCTEFCSIIRKDSKLRELCEKCDSRGGLEAVRKGKPYIYKCHMGLVDFAVPIIVQGQYLGALMAGQVLTEESKILELESITQCDTNIQQDKELMEAYKRLQTIPFDKIQSIAQMMFHISNYIVNESVLKIVQKELNEKNIEYMEAKRQQVEIEKELKSAQLKALYSQVNPHFLFNVLNSISALALIEEAPKTHEVICDLAKMLRYILKKVDQMVKLEDAINYVTAYLQIQKVRFRSRLEFYIDIKEECKKVEIPFMIIQPFVENSIIHGLELKEQGGMIKITVYESNNSIVICIEDNGIGIKNSMIELINSGKEEEYKRNTSSGIGIINIRQRLTHHYGDNYYLNINSIINKGTEVKIILPK